MFDFHYGSVEYPDSIYNTHRASDESILDWALDNMMELNLRPGDAVVDLGSGAGVAVFTFSQMGLKAYGVENDARVADLSRQFIRNARERFQVTHLHEPIISCTDYFSKGFRQHRFSDGHSLQATNAFYCFAYDDPGHIREVKQLVENIGGGTTPLILAYLDGDDPSVYICSPDRKLLE